MAPKKPCDGCDCKDDIEIHRNKILLDSIPDPETKDINKSLSTDTTESESESETDDSSSSYSTDVSSLGFEEALDLEHPPSISRYKMASESRSPLALLLVKATHPQTPKRVAVNTFDKLHIWAIEASDEAIDKYAWEIRNVVVPELLRYIYFHVQVGVGDGVQVGDGNRDRDRDRDIHYNPVCVSAALALIQRLSCRKDLDALVLIEAGAIHVLVFALSHNKNNSYNLKNKNAENNACLFQRLWDLLMDIVLSPSVVDHFHLCHETQKQKHRRNEKRYQRTRLITAVDLCLDRTSTSSCHSITAARMRMGQIFDTLSMLLRTEDKAHLGTAKPNDEIRDLLFQKNIATRCQDIIVSNASGEGEYEDDFQQRLVFEGNCNRDDATSAASSIPTKALSFFWMCLCDRDDDDLSESLLLLDHESSLARFVRRILLEFPRSSSLQGMGCQVLNKLAAKRNRNRNRLAIGRLRSGLRCAAISLPPIGNGNCELPSSGGSVGNCADVTAGVNANAGEDDDDEDEGVIPIAHDIFPCTSASTSAGNDNGNGRSQRRRKIRCDELELQLQPLTKNTDGESDADGESESDAESDSYSYSDEDDDDDSNSDTYSNTDVDDDADTCQTPMPEEHTSYVDYVQKLFVKPWLCNDDICFEEEEL